MINKDIFNVNIYYIVANVSATRSRAVESTSTTSHDRARASHLESALLALVSICVYCSKITTDGLKPVRVSTLLHLN